MSDNTIKKITKWLAITAVVAVLIYLSFLFFDIIIMVVLSLLLALIFNPFVKLLEKNKLNRLTAVIAVFLISGVILFLGFSILIPKILRQMNTIAVNVDETSINQLFGKWEETIDHYLPFISSEQLTNRISSFISGLFIDSINNISDIVTSIFSILAIVIIVPFMTFFILKDHQTIIKGMIDIMPNKYFEVSYWIIKKISIQLGRYVRGWIFDAFLVGSLAALGLTILGIKNSITIGAIAGIGHLIPYFGPVIGGIPAIIISVVQFGDLSMLPSIIIMFLIIYTFDNGYIQPNIFSKSTDMHPLIIILLILIGSQAMGVLGMLLAVPTATVVKTAAREIYFGYKNYKIIRT